MFFNVIVLELPYGQLPVLTVDGKKLAQSWTILRYLSKKHGAGGEGDWEQALVEGYGDFLHDLTLNCRPYFLVLLGRAQGDKAKMLEEIKPFMEKWTKNLDKILKESGSGFFAKSGPTYVDFFAANVYETAVKQKDNNVEHIAGLKTIHDNVKALPQLKEYFAKRADTPV